MTRSVAAAAADERMQFPIRSAISLLVLGFILGLAIGFLLALLAGTSFAHPGSPAPAGPVNGPAEQHTRDLVTLNARYHLAAAVDQGQIHGHLVSVALLRHQFLASTIARDPGTVRRVAIPLTLRASLPPQVQALVEEEAELEGDLAVLREDDAGGSGRNLHTLDVAGQRFTLHFAGDPPRLPSGTRVKARGVRLGQTLALGSGEQSVRALSGVLPVAVGPQDADGLPGTRPVLNGVVVDTGSEPIPDTPRPHAGLRLPDGPAAWVQASPVVTPWPSPSRWGAAVTLAVSPTNHDNAGCPASTFSLQASAPAGGLTALVSPVLVLDPEVTTTPPLTVTSSAGIDR